MLAWPRSPVGCPRRRACGPGREGHGRQASDALVWLDSALRFCWLGFFGVVSIRLANSRARRSASSFGSSAFMPQPLSKIRSDANIVMCNAGDRPTSHNPGLAGAAMEAIISWSNVEMFFLNMYVALMGGASEILVDAYLAHETQNAKLAHLNAVANSKLSQNNRRLFRAILALSRSAQKGRDKLAHWIWGYSPQLPDAFLLADPRTMARQSSPNINDIEETIRSLRSSVFVYTRQDFADIIQINDRLCGFGLRFQFIITNHLANQGDRLYDALCAEPEIRERLDRQV
jgi:hypothetical protein